MTDTPARYQDYVIRDGRFIGRFEDMYARFDDPWHHLAEDLDSTPRRVGLSICHRLHRLGYRRVVEIGCGLGRFAAALSQVGAEVMGIDVSSTAIAKARAIYPRLRFEVGGLSDHDVIAAWRPDVLVMSQVTWYVLPELKGFLDFLRQRLPDAFLYHIVGMYPGQAQKYGREYFTNAEELMAYFGMHYAEWGEIHAADGGSDAYFLGCWNEQQISKWRGGPT